MAYLPGWDSHHNHSPVNGTDEKHTFTGESTAAPWPDRAARVLLVRDDDRD